MRATSTISGVIAPLQNVAITSQLVEPADSVYRQRRRPRARGSGDRGARHGRPARATRASAEHRRYRSAHRRIRRREGRRRRATRAAEHRPGRRSGADARAPRSRRPSKRCTNDQVEPHARPAAARATATSRSRPSISSDTPVDNDRRPCAPPQAQPAVGDHQPAGQRHEQRRPAGRQRRVGRRRRARCARRRRSRRAPRCSSCKRRSPRRPIVSPIDGVVVNRNLNPGEYPGSRTIFTLQQLNNVYAELNASSADTFAIPVGAPVTLTSPAPSSQTYTGTRRRGARPGDARLDQLHRQGAGRESR